MSVIAPSPEDVSLALRLAAVPVAVSAAELLVRRKSLRKGGLLDFEILGLLKGSLGSEDTVTARLFRTLVHGRFYAFVLAVQMLCACAVVVAPRFVPLVVVTASLQLLMMKRNHLANDGSDDMVTVVLVATAVVSLASSHVTTVAWAVFLTGQLLLAYFVSGLSKAQSGSWWRGDAIAGIVGTRIFGHPRFAQILARHPSLGRALTWGTFVVEFLFPAALFAPRPIFLGALGAMLAFHLGCAVIMGLNTFVWAFAACYPAALWSWQWLAIDTSPVLRTAVVSAWLIFSATALVVLWARHRTVEDTPLPQPEAGLAVRPITPRPVRNSASLEVSPS